MQNASMCGKWLTLVKFMFIIQICMMLPFFYIHVPCQKILNVYTWKQTQVKFCLQMALVDLPTGSLIYTQEILSEK